MINSLVFWGIKGYKALDRNPVPGYNTLLLQLTPGNLYSVPIDSSTNYLAIYTVGLQCQIPILMPPFQAGRQFVPL